MDFPIHVFYKLHSLLKSEIFNNELTDVQCALLKNAEDYKMWFEEDVGKKGTNFFTRVFGKTAIARDHFFKKESTYKNVQAQKGNLRDDVFIAALKFLGFSYPDNAGLHEKTEILLKQFLAIYPQRTVPNLQDESTSLNAYNSILNYDEELGQVHQFIKEYFMMLNLRDFDSAFKLFIPSARNRYWNGLGYKFADEHGELVQYHHIRETTWLEIKDEIKTADAEIYYQRFSYSYTSDILQELRELTISDLPKFVEKMNLIAAQINNPKFKKQKIRTIFGDELMTFFKKTSNFEKLTKSVFPKLVSSAVFQKVECSLISINGKWFFDSWKEIDSDLYYPGSNK